MFNELKKKVFEAVEAGKIVINYMDSDTVNVRDDSETYVAFSNSSFESIKSMIDWIDSLNSNYDEFLDEVDEHLLDIFNLTRDIHRAESRGKIETKTYLSTSRAVASVTIYGLGGTEIYSKSAYLGDDNLELDSKSQEFALERLKYMILALEAVLNEVSG